MDRQSIATVLKQLRKTSGKSTAEISKELKEYGIEVSPKTIYGYESGISTPNADVFMVLCRIYNCDDPVSVFFGSPFSADESVFIIKFRALDDHAKKLIQLLLDEEYKRCSKPKTGTKIYTYLHKTAAAGTGVYLDDIPTDLVEVPEVKGADFIIGVNGDSMEPTFYDGDMVYVQRAYELNFGDIGIFQMNNEFYIKEYGKDGLISHNQKYDVIKGNNGITCIGKVLCKVE